ncbi:hypothetical protein [Arenimonas oryziterrae]|uniref:Glycosyltransferase RgtA/B/C/D-like domain-containing protein n=1 Tax=Arenimonas oryziterrae DSM 21050 = YC6267 TaxID=1121015 RepID=A0A091AUJ7_9GAMM|nr:hypothetical protein [Arenimonas oryziterrae]KFN43918.1 hypothetical protein N789_08190 [Arenimonas oryziterrae DSM 21050 = YC6267]
MKRLAALAPWGAALCGIVFTLMVFSPGYLSWDSAYQWWQARHGQFDGTHPPLLAMIWRAVEVVWPGPGGMFALQIVLIWSALAAFAAALPWPAWARIGLVLVFGFWPPLFGLSLHVWKDLWTLLAFAWALVFLTRELRRPSRALRLGAWFALVAACAFRHNAITGALPLLLWLAWREGLAFHGARVGRGWVLTVAGVLTVAAVFAAKLPTLDARVRPVDSVWSAVTLWDAAAVSLAENRLLIPAPLRAPTLTLADVRAHYTDYSNTTVYESGQIFHSLDGPYTDEQTAALRDLAWRLPVEHPRAYFAHRLRLAVLLFGGDRAGLPDDQVFSPGRTVYEDNPTPPLVRSPLHARVLASLMRLIDTPLFAGWIYLCLAALAMLVGFARLHRAPAAGLAAATAASCLAYALPLALVSGSAEFRYLAWPLLATGMAWALLLPRKEKTRTL